MRQCRQCARALDGAEATADTNAGPALGESYVLLPVSESTRGLGLGRSRSGGRRDDPNQNGNRAFSSRRLDESIVAVSTHADLSQQIEQLTIHRAHCEGLPVTTPVCKDCADIMLQQIDGQAERARYEKRCFTGYLHSTGSSVRNEEVDEIEKKIAFYQDEINALEENLELMEKEREELRFRQQSLTEDEAALEQEEALLWSELNLLQFDQHAFQGFRDSASAQMDTIERTTVGVQSHNVLNDMFSIGSSAPFATINNFRMGQLPAQPVEWNEINAGFGESALLLQTMAGMVGLTFTDFKLVPLGSFSKIIRISNLRMEYCLHGSDQDNFAESYFNLGLGAWLTCLGQLIAHVEHHHGARLRLPYKISKHSIGGYSVLFLKNKHAEWTKALKYALTNLKWLLTWVWSFHQQQQRAADTITMDDEDDEAELDA